MRDRQIDAHHLKKRADQTLSCPQRKSECVANDKDQLYATVAVILRSSSRASLRRKPLLECFRCQKVADITPLDQIIVVVLPIFCSVCYSFRDELSPVFCLFCYYKRNTERLVFPYLSEIKVIFHEFWVATVTVEGEADDLFNKAAFTQPTVHVSGRSGTSTTLATSHSCWQLKGEGHGEGERLPEKKRLCFQQK